MIKTFLFFLASIVLFGGCSVKPGILFREPQPAGLTDQVKFKNRFIGSYLSKNDSSILYITSKMIIREYYFLVKTTKKEIDSSGEFKIHNDSIFGEGTDSGIPCKMDKDSVTFNWHLRDTLFNISESNVLRYFQGSCYLNFRYDSNLWNVKKLSPGPHGKLILSSIDSAGLAILRKKGKIEESIAEGDSLKPVYLIKPSRKELKQIVRSGGFPGYEEFVKIKVRMSGIER